MENLPLLMKNFKGTSFSHISINCWINCCFPDDQAIVSKLYTDDTMRNFINNFEVF